jgi:broad specificity phosphatase PhoE
MSLSLYLLRHGETVYSRSGGFCGDIDPELTPEGTQMAQAFANTYRNVPWAAIYTSPMKRTIATVQPLCEAVGMQPQLRDGLKEIRYGQWENQTPEFVKQHYAQDYERWLTEPAWNAPTEGECGFQVASRSSTVISEIVEKYSSGAVLIVSHKATIRVILCTLLGIDLGQYRNRIAILVASVSVVKFGQRGPLLEVLGDRHHLPENLRNLEGT